MSGTLVNWVNPVNNVNTRPPERLGRPGVFYIDGDGVLYPLSNACSPRP
jgi:hypothetical protein